MYIYSCTCIHVYIYTVINIILSYGYYLRFAGEGGVIFRRFNRK